MKHQNWKWFDFIQNYLNKGIQSVICTDISKDGMLEDSSIELYKEIISKTESKLIASGGVSSKQDLLDLKAIGCAGTILGKAIYEGRITLKRIGGIMLKKRIIPCLDIKEGRTVKGINFVGLRDAGDPVELAKKYSLEGADELVFLDITATVEKRKTLVELVHRVAAEIDIPFTVGGGIKSVEDVQMIITAGADKVSINSSAIHNPNLIKEIADRFGSQCVVLAIDTKFVDNEWVVFINGGRTATKWKTLDWAKKGVELGAGEILLTSMNNDGTKAGFALDITAEISAKLNVPVIASGGAGTSVHFKDLFSQTKATAGLAASIFHFNEIPVQTLKTYLKQNNIPTR